MKQTIYLSILFLTILLVFPMGLPFAGGAREIEDIEKRLSETTVLADLLNFAYFSNPSINASKESWRAYIEKYRIGKSYPDPQLMMTYFPEPIETRLGPQDWNLNFSQAIPFPGKLAQKGKVLESDTKISKFKLDKTIKNIVASISSSYYELVYIQKAMDIARANFNLNRELLKIGENAYAGDRALFYDLSKAQAQTAQLQYDILLLDELEQTEKARINTLLNRDPNAPLGRCKELSFRDVTYTLHEIYDLSMTSQEDVLIARETAIKFEEAVKLSRYESLPSFKLGLFYATIGDPVVAILPRNAGDDAIGAQFGLSLPIWFNKNRSKTYKAMATQRKARADQAAIENSVKAKISRLWFKLQNSKRLITLYERELIPHALKSLQTAETWQREGNGSFSDFIEIQATAYNFQLSRSRAKADYGKTLIKLEQLAGVALDRKSAD